MPFFDQAGSPLSDADAAARQWQGHPVYDANGNPTTVVEANTPVDSAGDTEVTLSEDAPKGTEP
jgi:hypothetical protein